MPFILTTVLNDLLNTGVVLLSASTLDLHGGIVFYLNDVFHFDILLISFPCLLAGLKFKLNRTGAAIKRVSPEPTPNLDTSTQSDDSNSGYEDNVVVDDNPDPPQETIKKYRFSCELYINIL